MLMNQNDKCEMLRKTIERLYSKEGRSKSYISDLLGLNRKTLSKKINEWSLPIAEPRRHASPSTQKFINKNRQFIKSRLDCDVSITAIAKELKCDRKTIQLAFTYDDVLNKAYTDYTNRRKIKSSEKRNAALESSYLQYDFCDIDREIWTPILGYDNYFVSNMGRVKKFIKSYNKCCLLRPNKNESNGRFYVCLYNECGRKNINLARLVAHAFCSGFSDKKNTVNHKDGDVTNNKSENLEWVSQSENNIHSYDKLNRKKNVSKPLSFYILYKDCYKFKTVSAFARFINKSETQARRYLKEPEKHDIKLINK